VVKARIIYKCKRCGWTWMSRKNQVPITCAKCRSPYWNIKKKVKVSKDDIRSK